MPDTPVVDQGDITAGSPTSTPASDAAPTATPAVTAPGGATPPADTPPAWATGQGEPPKWYRERISEETRRRQQTEQAYQRAQAEAELVRRQLQALTGATPQPAEDPNAAQIRQELEKYYPGLSKLGSLEQQLQAVQEFVERHWQSTANSTMQAVWKRFSEDLGQDLPEEHRRILHGAFVAYLEADQSRLGRYASGDQTLIDDFHNAVQSGLLDPYRKRTMSAAATRATAVSRLPRQGPGTTLVGKPKSTPKTWDEMEKALENVELP